MDSGIISAYDTGLMFSNAFKLLINQHVLARGSLDYDGFALVVPAMVNGAFACELFLKSLLNEATRGHKLYSDLFCKLDQTSQQLVESVFTEVYRNETGVTMTTEQFTSEFKAIERTFEELRYFYETKENSKLKVYNIGFMNVLVSSLRGICEEKLGKRPIQR